MDRITALPRGMQLMLLGGVLLLIDSFFNWQEVEVEVLGISEGVSAWHGWGFLVGLLTIALIAWIAVRAFATDVQLPLSDGLAAAVLGGLIVLTTLLKVLVDNEFRTVWAWLGLLFAVMIAVGAWLQFSAGEEGTMKMRADSGAPMPPPQAPPPPPSSEAAPPPSSEPAPPPPSSSEAAPPPPPRDES